MNKKFARAVGKWCLIKSRADWFGKPRQAKIMRLSPSGGYVQYHYSNEDPLWRDIREVDLLEILDYGS